MELTCGPAACLLGAHLWAKWLKLSFSGLILKTVMLRHPLHLALLRGLHGSSVLVTVWWVQRPLAVLGEGPHSPGALHFWPRDRLWGDMHTSAWTHGEDISPRLQERPR